MGLGTDGCGNWGNLLQVVPPSRDFHIGADTPGPQFPENATMTISRGFTGLTAMLGSVSARLLGSSASVAISTTLACAIACCGDTASDTTRSSSRSQRRWMAIAC